MAEAGWSDKVWYFCMISDCWCRGLFWGGGAMGAGLCLNPILSFYQNFLKIVSVSLFDHSHTMFFVLDFMYHITCGE